MREEEMTVAASQRNAMGEALFPPSTDFVDRGRVCTSRNETSFGSWTRQGNGIFPRACSPADTSVLAQQAPCRTLGPQMYQRLSSSRRRVCGDLLRQLRGADAGGFPPEQLVERGQVV